MNIVLAAVLVMIVAIISIMFRSPRTIIVNAAPATLLATDTPLAAGNEVAGPELAVRQVDGVKEKRPPAEAQQPATEQRTVSVPTPQIQAGAPALASASPVTPQDSTSDRVLKYTAQPGDSVSVLAAGLLGANSKTNRDAIIGENKSLQDDPDHVVSGKTYQIPTTTGLSAATVARPTTQPEADHLIQRGPNRELRYTARAGDSVAKLAQILLGSDTAANRDAIINNNISLKNDPDRVMIGQIYWIPAPDALVAKP